MMTWTASFAGDPSLTKEGDPADRVEDLLLLPPLEEGVVNVEVLGVAARDFVAQFAADTLYLPYLSLCDLLRIPATLSEGNDLLSGEFPLGEPFEISRGTGTARRRGTEYPFPSGAVRLVGDEVFIEQGALFHFLGIRSSFRLSKLTLTVSADERLPIVQWGKNRKRYASLEDAGRSTGRGAAEYSVSRSWIGGPIIDWTLSNNMKLSNGYTNAMMRVGGQFLFGELELGATAALQQGSGRKPRLALDSWRWQYQAPDFPLLTRVTVGDLPIAGEEFHAIDLSNVPLLPRSGFVEHILTGQTQPGWTIELYEGTRLVNVAVADSLGYYAFQIPVGYGTVDRTLRFIGTYGEIITEQRRIQLDANLVPAGELEYTLRAGGDRFNSSSRLAGQGRVDFGVTNRLTVGAQATVRPGMVGVPGRDSISSMASATYWIGESSTLGLHYRPEASLFSGEFYSITPSNMSLRIGFDSLSPKQRTFISSLSATMPVGAVSFGGAGFFERRESGYAITAAPQISGYVGGINWSVSTAFALPFPSRPAGEVRDSTLPARSTRTSLWMLATPVRGVLLGIEGTYDHMARSIVGCQLSSYFRLIDGVGISFGYGVPGMQWSRGTLTAQLELALSPTRVFAFASREPNAEQVSGTVMAQGSVVTSGRGVGFYRDFSLGKSTIIVRPFRDDNGNGEFDPGEIELRGVDAKLRQGGMWIAAEDGAFTLVPSNMLWTLEVDRWSMAEDGLFPSRYHYTIFSSPSTVVTVDVPYVQGFDVTGRCFIDDSTSQGGRSLNGIRVQLSSTANGSLYDGEMFSDGTVLFTGIAGGSYTLMFDQEQLASRHLAPPAGLGTITIDRNNPRIPAIPLSRTPR